MKHSIIFPVAICIALCTACGHSEQHSHTHNAEAPSKAQASGSGEQQIAGMALNNGERWEANLQTTEGVHNMKTILNLHSKDAKDCNGLAAKLDKEFNLLLEQCTMQGEAHEQLHHYLMPLKALINELTNTPDDCSAIIDRISSHLDRYHEWFR
jgi:hypothetical protein